MTKEENGLHKELLQQTNKISHHGTMCIFLMEKTLKSLFSDELLTVYKINPLYFPVENQNPKHVIL